MHVEDLDVPVGSEHARGALDQVRQQRHAKRRVGGAQHGDLLGGGGDAAVGEIVESGGADQDRDAGRSGAVEARLERGGRGEIDQDIGVVGVEREARDRRRPRRRSPGPCGRSGANKARRIGWVSGRIAASWRSAGAGAIRAPALARWRYFFCSSR